MRRIVAQVPLFDVAIMLLVLRSPFDRSIRKRSIKCIGGSWRSSLPHIALRCARNQLQASQKSTEIKKASSAFAKEVHVRETGFEPATC